jgi:hypothetical protein
MNSQSAQANTVSDEASKRKAIEVIADLQWKAIVQVIDALTKGFTMYFVILAATLGFMASQFKDGKAAGPVGIEALVLFLTLMTVMAIIGLVLASRGIARATLKLSNTLKHYHPSVCKDLQVEHFMSKAVKYIYYACGLGASALLGILFLCSRLA